ncbi:ArsI/CadI family heavy metal resistance metalloenzyme [Streptomyces sp. NPDC048187]|uniref:ArsI/CadI family heavy metal resistance metalloenzyme n=1 Tax=Streptomyces sp. NPDC048187 TaxID=3365509 RepID=UPI00371BF9BD
MSRAQLALRVSDLEASITFYSRLFGTDPAKRREGYANFAITEPPLKLVLIEGEPGEETRLDHLGVEVESTEEVTAATTRLKDAGLATFEEDDTSCCYALQDKVWVHGPGKEPWEVYVVKADADTLGKSAALQATGDGCCASRPAVEAPSAAGCACGQGCEECEEAPAPAGTGAHFPQSQATRLDLPHWEGHA